jgi:VanZ family protein
MARHRSSAVPLAWLYAGLIVYASLYPFSGWLNVGVSPLQFLVLPWSRWWSGFDLVSNLLGYLPLGVLVFGAMVRSGWRPSSAATSAVTLGALLSFAMELTQNFLPQRVPSNVDLLLNAAGAAAGAALGAAVHRLGVVGRWQVLRERWFIERSAGGIVLIVLWPVGLLLPTPVPLVAGQAMGELRETAVTLVEGTLAAEWFAPWLEATPNLQPLSASAELSAIMLGLLAPCMVAFAIARPGWRRLLLVLCAVVLGFSATTLSTALNFGPDHALAWRTPTALAGLAAGTLLAALLASLPCRAAAGLGLVALGALVVLVAQAPADPYYAQSLQAWEQGRFIRFHGAARWVGWLWPYVALVYLLLRVGDRVDV